MKNENLSRQRRPIIHRNFVSVEISLLFSTNIISEKHLCISEKNISEITKDISIQQFKEDWLKLIIICVVYQTKQLSQRELITEPLGADPTTNIPSNTPQVGFGKDEVSAALPLRKKIERLFFIDSRVKEKQSEAVQKTNTGINMTSEVHTRNNKQ